MTTAWLPFIRGLMDGASYQWATTFYGWQLGGRGMAGDYWYALLRSAVGLVLLWGAWRRPTRLVRWLIAVYAVATLGDIAWAALANPDGFRFRGDTLGVDISLTWVASVLAAAFAVVAIRFALFDDAAPAERLTGFSASGRRRLTLAVGLVPVQWALLSSATGMDWRDMMGVALTIAQWWLVSAGLSSGALGSESKGIKSTHA
jgi:hypothetical protein